MKIVFFSLWSISLFATTCDMGIYNNLNVAETSAESPPGYALWLKTAGGISCSKMFDSNSSTTTYTCVLPDNGPSGLNSEELFKKLSKSGVSKTSQNSKSWTKKIECLECVKTNSFGEDFSTSVSTTYSCRLSI